ncbi:hypothetical protein Tco_0801781 [Tanacetum coccineum]|uniref:Uncharacterized protein n=1 Tax=Tanacetum coccineum TaxID=301880 RepID=A0ABQ4ZX59_9ASTR
MYVVVVVRGWYYDDDDDGGVIVDVGLSWVAAGEGWLARGGASEGDSWLDDISCCKFNNYSARTLCDVWGGGGANPFTQGTISSIPIGGSISPEGFLLPVLLLVVIIVTVVIVISLSDSFVDDVIPYPKLSFTIIKLLAQNPCIITDPLISRARLMASPKFEALEEVNVSSILLGNSIDEDFPSSFSAFGTMFGHKTANS